MPGFSVVHLFAKYIAQVIVGFDVTRLQSDRTPKMDARLVQLSLILEHAAQVVLCLGRIRTQGERLLKAEPGVLKIALSSQDMAEVNMRVDGMGVQRDRAPMMGDRLVRPP